MIPYNVVELTILSLLFLFKAYSPLYFRDSLVAIHSWGGAVWSRHCTVREQHCYCCAWLQKHLSWNRLCFLLIIGLRKHLEVGLKVSKA